MTLLPWTVLMCVVPAVVAGWSQVIVVCAPVKGDPCSIDQFTITAVAVLNEVAQLFGTYTLRVFTVGGAQVVVALT